MKIEYKFSEADIADVLDLLNEFLKHISIISLSRAEVEIADPERRFIGTSNSRYHNIVKVINRWGIKEEDGQYYKLLNGVISRISSVCPMLQIYKPMQLLLFNKLLEGWGKGAKTEFAKEEIEIFFLQPFEMIVSSCIPASSVYLYSLITESLKLSAKLKSEDSREFLNEGIGRRLFMLKANVDSIARIYDEHRVKCLDEEENTILSQDINLFYTNVYAILDCLAFVLAFECPDYKIDRKNKHQYRNIGLFNEEFYSKINELSDKLNLIKLKPWYGEIADLRHPIAHRIPLYFPEMYTPDDERKIKEINEEHSENFNAIIKNSRTITNDENHRVINVKDLMDQINKLDDAIDKLREKKQKAESNIKVFSGRFLHSIEESQRFYHLSRLTLDLGILYYLLNKSFEYINEICS